MGHQALHCPFCQQVLRRISRREDYFCRACHAVVEVVEGVASIRRDIRVAEEVMPLERLKPAEHGSLDPD